MFALLLLLPGVSQAIVLDWSNVSWTPGSLSASFDIDASNAGNDITIDIIDSSHSLVSGYPYIGNEQTGGITPANDALHMLVGFISMSDQVTVKVTFNYVDGVNNVALDLFDVDNNRRLLGLAGFTDQIRDLTATLVTGGLIGPPTVTGSSDNTVAGSGTNITVTGTAQAAETSGSGNVKIGFGTNFISGFQFTYGNGPTPLILDQQEISIYNITYDKKKPVVPEFGVTLAAVLLCFGAITASKWRNVFVRG